MRGSKTLFIVVKTAMMVVKHRVKWVEQMHDRSKYRFVGALMVPNWIWFLDTGSQVAALISE